MDGVAFSERVRKLGEVCNTDKMLEDEGSRMWIREGNSC